MKLKPLADRVVLKQNAAEERTSSGIFLTASAQEKPEVYEVVEVGPGGVVDGNEVKMVVSVGDQVLGFVEGVVNILRAVHSKYGRELFVCKRLGDVDS